MNRKSPGMSGEEHHYQLGILLLAAGASRRFDGIKQLAELRFEGHHEGTPKQSMLQMAINTVCALSAEYRVVTLGANKDKILPAIDVPGNLEVKITDSWQEGIAASIRSGVQALSDCSNELSHILIVLADQPGLSVDDYTQLIKMSRNNLQNIICAHYGQKNAVPAIFPTRYFSLLTELQGDKGAGKALNSAALAGDIISVGMQKGEQDIDTQRDLARYVQDSR